MGRLHNSQYGCKMYANKLNICIKTSDANRGGYINMECITLGRWFKKRRIISITNLTTWKKIQGHWDRYKEVKRDKEEKQKKGLIKSIDCVLN